MATSDTYRAENPEEFDLILRWRLADSPSLFEYYQQAMAGARFDASRDVGGITSPTLVIHGAEDRYVPVANAAALAQAIPNARLRVLDDAGHLVFIERAEEVNKEIVSFLKPQRKWKPERSLTKQKKEQIIVRAKKVNREIISHLKPRKPRKAKKGSTFGKLKGRLRRQSRVPDDWVKKLRGWIYSHRTTKEDVGDDK